MKILNVYLDETRQHLPIKNRDDIIAEIRSVLMDMIEERNPNPGSTPDEAIIKAVLSDFGSPRQVARQYSKHQYLVGPQIFPVYLQVLKIVLTVVAAVSILGVIIAIISGSATENGFFITALETVGGLFSSLFITFGIVTLSFVLIERFSPPEWQAEFEDEWSPDDLKEKADQHRVKIPSLAVEITLGIFLIVLLNVYLDWIGIYFMGDSGWVSTPILNENFLRYVPWITAFIVLEIALNLYLIRKAYWDTPASIAMVSINLFKIGVLVAIIVGPTVISIDPTALQALNLELGVTAQTLSQQANTGFRILLGLVNFGIAVDTITHLIRILSLKRQSGYKIKVG